MASCVARVMLAQVWRAYWHMFMYGGKTPKRHVGYSNSAEVGLLSTGKLRGWVPCSNATKTYRNYIDKAGNKRYTATANLKSTQSLGF